MYKLTSEFLFKMLSKKISFSLYLFLSIKASTFKMIAGKKNTLVYEDERYKGKKKMVTIHVNYSSNV